MSEPDEGMKRIYVSVSTNKVGSRCETYFDIKIGSAEDTEVEIETAAREVMFEMIEFNYQDTPFTGRRW